MTEEPARLHDDEADEAMHMDVVQEALLPESADADSDDDRDGDGDGDRLAD